MNAGLIIYHHDGIECCESLCDIDYCHIRDNQYHARFTFPSRRVCEFVGELMSSRFNVIHLTIGDLFNDYITCVPLRINKLYNTIVCHIETLYPIPEPKVENWKKEGF